MNEYKTVVYWSEEDGVYVVNVPALPGCMAHGRTRDEALRRVEEAVGLWIDTARKDGQCVPTPSSE